MAVKTPAPQRAAGRRKLARAKKALPDGSFPIPDVNYLGKAIRSVGRAAPGKRPALARLIRKRARQLGSAGMAKLKGSWADNTQSSKAMANALYCQLIELNFTPELAKAEVAATLPFMIHEFATPVVGSGDGPKVTKLAYDKNTPGRSKPNAQSRKAGKQVKWDPDGDGDNDAAPATDRDNDKAGGLSPRGKQVMRKCIARGMSPAAAYKVAKAA